MGDWYFVIKTIKGRQYRYRQRTWREGGRVRTESYSLGRVSSENVPINATAFQPAVSAKHLVKQHLMPVFSALRDASLSDAEWIMPWDADKVGLCKTEAKLEALIKASKVRINRSGNSACYSIQYDLLTMPPANTFKARRAQAATEAYYLTVLHELAHWTGHRSRLGRFVRSGNLREQVHYAREEMVAEATAIIVLKALGHELNLGQAVTYFRRWMNRSGNLEEAFNHAILEAERAAEFILEIAVNTTDCHVL